MCQVRLEELCADHAAACVRMGAHVSLGFGAANSVRAVSRYDDSRPQGISADIAYEYRQHFDAARSAYIARVFKAFGDWFTA